MIKSGSTSSAVWRAFHSLGNTLGSAAGSKYHNHDTRGSYEMFQGYNAPKFQLETWYSTKIHPLMILLNSSFTLIDLNNWMSECVEQIFVQVNGIWGKWKMTGGTIFAWSKTNKPMSFSTRWRQYHYVLGDSSEASFCIILGPGPLVTSVECEAWWGNDTSQMTPSLCHVSYDKIEGRVQPSAAGQSQ